MPSLREIVQMAANEARGGGAYLRDVLLGRVQPRNSPYATLRDTDRGREPETLAAGLKTILEFLSPAGDMKGYYDSSRDAGEAARRGDLLDALSNAGWAGLNLATVALPGSAQGYKQAAEEAISRAKSVADDIGKRGAKSIDSDAARMARAKSMGYRDEVFWRGEATGTAPNKYPENVYFSRDKDVSAGHAQRGGAPEPREFRLKFDRPFSYADEATLGDYADLIRGAIASGDMDLARKMGANPPVAGDWNVEKFLKVTSDPKIAGMGLDISKGHLYHELEFVGAANPEAVIRNAGYDAIDTGRDVRMLKKTGIRLASAKFDPKLATSTDINHTIAPIGAAGLGSLYYASQDND